MVGALPLDLKLRQRQRTTAGKRPLTSTDEIKVEHALDGFLFEVVCEMRSMEVISERGSDHSSELSTEHGSAHGSELATFVIWDLAPQHRMSVSTAHGDPQKIA